MADSIDMIVPMLSEMRADMTSGFATVDRRLDRIEETRSNFRNALTADSLLSKLVTGEFESRIETLERKVRELESQK